jgi:hypothetical protein
MWESIGEAVRKAGIGIFEISRAMLIGTRSERWNIGTCKQHHSSR